MASISKKVIWYLTNKSFRFSMNNKWGFYRNMDDEEFLKKSYFAYTGRELDINNPQTFNEKLQWLKLNDRNELYISLVDKYESKKYVKELLGEQFIIPNIGVWDTYDDIEFDELPNQFVLKCTHDSGGLIICRDKSKLDYNYTEKKIKRSLSRNYFWVGREWPYKGVRPRVIAEQYMEDENCSCESGLTDYKFFCFNGEPRFIYISKGLENHATASISFYDLDGNELYFHRSDYRQFHNCVFPPNFNEMTEIARKLAKSIGCDFVRIDLYSINNRIYFSEITFSPCSGIIPFEPKEADAELGKLLVLHKDKLAENT